MVSNWLITGGCGFLGTSLISKLLDEGQNTRIRVLDNLSVGTTSDLTAVCQYIEKQPSPMAGSPAPNSVVELVVGDIRDYRICLECSQGMDVIVHFAANTGVGPSVEDPRADMEANVIGTFNMLEAARNARVGKFVFASSGAPLGEVEPPIHEEKPAHPVSPYGASKLAGEGYCSAYYRTFGLKTVALRFGNVYGPLSQHKNSIIAKFFKLALNDNVLEIYGDGNQTRDFIYIDDLVQAILCAASAEVGGEVFQIATHKETTVNDIALAIKEIVSRERSKEVKIVHSKPRLGDVKRNYSDISKAKKMLGYNPQYDLRAGLLKTYEYFNAHGENTLHGR